MFSSGVSVTLDCLLGGNKIRAEQNHRQHTSEILQVLSHIFCLKHHREDFNLGLRYCGVLFRLNYGDERELARHGLTFFLSVTILDRRCTEGL